MTAAGGRGADCLDSGALARLVAGDVAAAEEAGFAGHLEGCVHCRERLREAAGGTEWLTPGELRDSAGETARPPELEKVIESASRVRPGAPAESRDGPEPVDLRPYLEPSSHPGAFGRLGDCDLVSIIGEGGMGVVAKARQAGLDRDVAVKILAPARVSSAAARERFRAEARAIGQIVHPCVVAVHSVGESGTIPYLVMELVEGESLESRISRDGGLDLDLVIEVAKDIARGLGAAHSRGIVHRDVKPANVLLDARTGRAKLSDFGLARALGASSLTSDGRVVGTPGYMSPEQARGETADARSDLFALGCVIYRMLAGRDAFSGESPLAVLRAVADTEPPSLADCGRQIPGWLRSLVEALLEKDPADRPGSAGEVVRALEAREYRRGRTPAGAAPPRRPWRPVVIALAALGMAGVLAWRLHVPGGGGSSGGGSIHAGPAQRHAAEREVEDLGEPHDWPVETVEELSDAVARAASGDLITLAWDGPRELPRLEVGSKALTFRAAAGHVPAISTASPDGLWIDTEAPLFLEGVELLPGDGDVDGMIIVRGAPIGLRSCRILRLPSPSFRRLSCVSLHDVPAAVIECCAVAVAGIGLLVESTGAGPEPVRVVSRDSLYTGREFLRIRELREHRLEITIERNSFRALLAVFHVVRGGAEPIVVDASRNVFDAETLIVGRTLQPFALADELVWRDSRNHYANRAFLSRRPPKRGTRRSPPAVGVWRLFLDQPESGSVYGSVRFEGGDLDPLNIPSAELVAPATWRLVEARDANGTPLDVDRLESLGPDVAQVGPGEAHDRWRRSSGYAAWAAIRRRLILEWTRGRNRGAAGSR